MEYQGYCIQETTEGFKVYLNYTSWLNGEESLHTAGSLEEAKLWVDGERLLPHGEYQKAKKTYTDAELIEIAKIFL